MESYGMRLRERIMELYEQDKSTAEIARILGTSESGTRRVRQQERERGTLEPRTGGGGGKPALDEPRQRQLRDLVASQPDATLAELRDRLKDAAGVKLSTSSVDRWCTRLGLRFKKKQARFKKKAGGRRSRTAPT